MNQYYGQTVTEAKPLGGHRVQVTFKDGYTGKIDLGPMIEHGPIFAPLRRESFFRKVNVSDWGVLEWPGEIDLSPGSLRAWCEAGKVLNMKQTDEWIEQHSRAPKRVA
jgi:hypothetical protein